MKFLSQLWFPVDPLQQKSFAFIQNIPGSASKCWSPLAAHIWNVTARFLWCVCVCVCVWEFDASVSFFFCWIFLSRCSVRPGCIWDIDEKGWGQKNVAFSYLKALSVSLGFQSVLSADRKMVVWNLLCRLYWIGTGRSLFFSRCLAQGRGASTIRCVFLI